MVTLTKQYLDSGTYELSLEESTSLDLNSYVYSRFGTFKIVPVTTAINIFESLEKYTVFLDSALIGEVYINANDVSFENAVAYAMSTALDIISNKITELLDAEERAVLSKIVNDIVDGINISEEQKAMYRTFLIEQGTLDDVEEEIKTPTDIFGDHT